LGYSGQIVVLSLLAMISGIPATLLAPLSCSFRSRDRMDVDAFINIIGKTMTLVATAVVLRLGGGLTEVILMQAIGGVSTLVAGAIAMSGSHSPAPSGVLAKGKVAAEASHKVRTTNPAIVTPAVVRAAPMTLLVRPARKSSAPQERAARLPRRTGFTEDQVSLLSPFAELKPPPLRR